MGYTNNGSCAFISNSSAVSRTWTPRTYLVSFQGKLRHLFSNSVFGCRSESWSKHCLYISVVVFSGTSRRRRLGCNTTLLELTFWSRPPFDIVAVVKVDIFNIPALFDKLQKSLVIPRGCPEGGVIRQCIKTIDHSWDLQSGRWQSGGYWNAPNKRKSAWSQNFPFHS